MFYSYSPLTGGNKIKNRIRVISLLLQIKTVNDGEEQILQLMCRTKYRICYEGLWEGGSAGTSVQGPESQ
jgi:hypothetical protein